MRLDFFLLVPRHVMQRPPFVEPRSRAPLHSPILELERANGKDGSWGKGRALFFTVLFPLAPQHMHTFRTYLIFRIGKKLLSRKNERGEGRILGTGPQPPSS